MPDPLISTINIKYQSFYWSIIKETRFKIQDLNWIFGPNSYNISTNLTWSTYPLQVLTKELNWATRPQIVKDVNIYYTISPTIEQGIQWVVSPTIIHGLNWSIGSNVTSELSWSIANVLAYGLSWSVTN